MGKRAARRPVRDPGGRGEGRPSWLGAVRAWSRWDEEGPAPPPGRPWPSWACWLVSALLLFHIVALAACELAGQPQRSGLELDLGRQFWWYVVLINQEYAHAFFAPEPDPATPVVTARLRFAGGSAVRAIRLPDRSTRPRIRYLRQIALAWHLFYEWSGGPSRRSYWAASYARHLCRTNPGCTSVELSVRQHGTTNPGAVAAAVARGEAPDLDSEDFFSLPELIGVFSCDDF